MPSYDKQSSLPHQNNSLKPEETTEPNQEPPLTKIGIRDHAHLNNNEKALSPSALFLKEKKLDLVSAKKRYEELRAKFEPKLLKPLPPALRKEETLAEKIKRALLK